MILRSLLIIVAGVFVLSASECDKERKHKAAAVMEEKFNNVGPETGCEMSQNPSLQQTLDLNRKLQSTVVAQGQGCKDAAAALNQQNSAIRTLYHGKRNFHDIKHKFNHYQTELVRLKALGDPIYATRITSLESEVATMQNQLQGRNWELERQRRDVRRQEVDRLPDVSNAYTNVLSNCSPKSPGTLMTLAHSGMNLASAMTGVAGAGAMAASLVTQIASQFANNIMSSGAQLKRQLSSARVPYMLICGIESVARGFCLSKKSLEQSDIQSASCGCSGNNPEINSLRSIANILPELKGLYNQQDNTTPKSGSPHTQDRDQREKQDAERNLVENIDRIGQLKGSIGQIETYLKTVERQTQGARGGNAGRARKGVNDLRQTLNRVMRKSESEDPVELAKLFKNPDNNIHRKLNQVFMDNYYMTKGRLDSDHKAGRINARAHGDMKQDLLNARTMAKISMQSAADQTAGFAVNVSVPTGTVAVLQNGVQAPLSQPAIPMPEAVVSNKQHLQSAYLSANVISSFSQFVSKNSPIDNVISVIEKNLLEGKAVGVERRSGEGLIKQLCLSSLTLFKPPEKYPNALANKCQKYKPMGNENFTNYAKRDWDKRSCVVMDSGLSGFN